MPLTSTPPQRLSTARILEALGEDTSTVLRLWSADAPGVEAKLTEARAGLVRLGVPTKRIVGYRFPVEAEDPGVRDNGTVGIEVGAPKCPQITE